MTVQIYPFNPKPLLPSAAEGVFFFALHATKTVERLGNRRHFVYTVSIVNMSVVDGIGFHVMRTTVKSGNCRKPL